MRIGIWVWNLEDTTRFLDLIVTYRWWVSGKGPWSVSGTTLSSSAAQRRRSLLWD